MLIKIFGFLLSIAFFISFSSCQVLTWNQTCGSTQIPYPFYVQQQSLTEHEPFKLLCKNQTLFFPLASGRKLYRVLNLSSDGLLIDPLIDSSCTLPNVEFFNLTEPSLFAISSLNYLQVYNCSHLLKSTQRCSIPNPLDNCTHFRSSGCLSFNYTSYKNVSHYCQFFTSWVLQGTITLSYEAAYGLKLDWALPKFCNGSSFCSQDAQCYNSTAINPGHTCKCNDGFKGDGYNEGIGCTSEVSACNISTVASNCDCQETTECVIPTRNVAKFVAIGTGIIAGIMILASLIVACAWILKKKVPRVPAEGRYEAARQLKDLLSIHREGLGTDLFSYKEIEKATKVFSPNLKVGSGAWATVYAGRLQDGRLVAVKRINYSNTQGFQQVVNEVEVLCKVNHRCLVSLLGCCIDKDDPLLVFEYVPNGTLWEHLQRHRGQGLDWYTRLTIATDTAEALAHLHSLDPPIFHRDVKSSNILLDFDFNVKVADFGISRLALGVEEGSHISTIPQGTPGYLDPEYHINFHLSDKSDVYSFGVVLIEIITALKPIDFSREKRAVSLAALALAKIGNDCLDDIIDPFLQADKNPTVKGMVQRVAELAFRCLAYDKDARPNMRETMEELRIIRCVAASIPVTEKATSNDGGTIEGEEEEQWESEENSPSETLVGYVNA